MNFKLGLIARVIEKVGLLVEDLLTEDRPLSFLALFLRDDSQNKWDLVVSAPWMDGDKRAAVALIAEKLNMLLDSEEILAISRIATIDSSDPRLLECSTLHFPGPDGKDVVTARGFPFFGMDIDTAFLFKIPQQFHYTGVEKGT